MKDQRPTLWPCSADSSRNAGSPGASARSFRNAETGVSQSSTKLCRSGIRLWPAARARALSRPGSITTAVASCSPSAASAPLLRAGLAAVDSSAGAPGELGATAIEHPLSVGERASAAAQEHEQVVEHVGRLFVDPLL